MLILQQSENVIYIDLTSTDWDGSMFEEWSINVVLPTDEIRNVTLHTHHIFGKETERDYKVELLRQERELSVHISWMLLAMHRR